MASFNQVTIAGNITRDPEVKYLQSGKAVCELGVAINQPRKGQNGERIDNTIFVDVTLWERTAEIAGEYLKKGAPVLIGGELAMDQWEKDGKKFSKLKITGRVLQMLGSPGGNKGGQHSQAGATEDEYPQAPPSRQAAPPADDIPF
jgi:single-strand DNA-binding protein